MKANTANKTSNPFEREARLRTVTELYLTGRRQADIAEELGVSQQQISYDLRVIRERWRKETTINLDEAKAKELARIDVLETTYWEAWQQSITEQVKTRVKQGTAGADGQVRGESSVDRVNLLGVPAYLQGVQWCITERCRILGLYAPQKLAPTTPDGREPYTGLTADKLARARAEVLAEERKLLGE